MILVSYLNFGPHHRARAAALSKIRPDTTFLEIAAQEPQYPWEAGWQESSTSHFIRLAEKSSKDLPEWRLFRPIWSMLDNIRPDILVFHGLLSPGFKTMALWAKCHGVPAVLHIDSTYSDAHRTWWRQLMKAQIYRQSFVAAFASGERTRNYLQSLGFSENVIWTGGDVVDNHYFRESAVAARANPEVRALMNLPREYFVCVARYHEVKDHRTLLNAYKTYVASGGLWDLVLVGDGPLRVAIAELVEHLGLKGRVHQRLWASYEELPSIYAYAKCFILASKSETWGLVVNEAAASGLPLIISQNCGCVPDMCLDGINGFTFRSGNVDQLAYHMLNISAGEVDLDEFGCMSQRLVARWTPENWAEALVDCTDTVLNHGGSNHHL